MLSNSMTFSNVSQHEVRVAFDPDGTVWYCCNDLASLLGYKAPGKVVSYAENVEGTLPTEIRQISWFNTKGMFKRNFVSKIRCYSEKTAMLFLKRSAVPNDAVRWFINEVVPEARRRGEEIAKENMAIMQQTQEMFATSQCSEAESSKPVSTEMSVVDRLDAIILECALLKRELLQTR